MGPIIRNWRTTLAVLFSVGIIGWAFMQVSSQQPPVVTPAPTQSSLLQAIATKDSDGDGLPDWEESLYGTDPHVVDSRHLGLTDSQAVSKGLIVPKAVSDIPVATSTPEILDENGLPPPAPAGTLTAGFSQKFLDSFTAAKRANGGTDLSDTEMANIVSETISSLSTSIAPAPSFKSIKDLKIKGAGAQALRAFAVTAETALSKITSIAKDAPLTELQKAIQDGDQSALDRLAASAKLCRDAAVALAAIPVPIEAAKADLGIINGYMHLGEISGDFAREESDPLTALLALHQYIDTVREISLAFVDMSTVYRTAGVTFAPGEPGEQFVNAITDIASSTPSKP